MQQSIQKDQSNKQQEYQHVYNSKSKKILQSKKHVKSQNTSLESNINIISSNISIELQTPSPASTPTQKNNPSKMVQYIFLEQQKYKLGSGSYGSVYKCYTKQNNKIYRFALKVIKVPEYHGSIASGQDIIDTTRQQIKTLMKFKNNPNIIKIQDLIRDGNTIYLILQYCNDKDIISYFKKLRQGTQAIFAPLGKNQIQSIQTINFFFAQLLNGFKDLNSHKITHRDIKPGNILVKDGVLKIADFGLSKPLFQKSQLMSEFVGTLCTAAPQIKYKQQYTAKCDIYSLGAVYYWMIYNKYPYKDMLSKQQYLNTTLQFLDISYDGYIVTQEVKKLIRSMLAYQQDNRPQWDELFNHKFFVRFQKNPLQSISRMSFDRGLTMLQSQDFNNQIPQQFYKYINQKDIQLNRISVDQYQDFIIIMKSINYFNLKIMFFKQLLRQLSNFISREQSETQIEEETLCEIMRLGIQKYTIYLLKKLESEITFKDIPQILDRKAVKSLQNQQQFNMYSKDLISQIHSFEQSQQKPKLSRQKIKLLKKKCQQYKIFQQFQQILKDSKQGINQQQILYQISKSIMQMIFLLKPQIKNFPLKKQNIKTTIQQNRFKYLILLIHHMNMFVMHKQVFDKNAIANSGRNSQVIAPTDFIKKEKFNDKESFVYLVNQIQFLLDRFEE